MYKNILKDEKFEKGFKLKGLSSIRDGHSPKKIICGNGSIPDWFLCQWNSRSDMAINGVIEQNGNVFRFYDESKTVVTDKSGTIILSLDASKEYSKPRKSSEPWPHLLLEQDIEPYVKLSKINSLKAKGRFTLTEFIDYMGDSAEEYHTAQFVWVTVIKNVNEASEDFGHFIWVVMSIYDERYEFAPLYCAQDKALPDGEFIYSFCSSDYMTGKLAIGKPQDIEFDIYPKMEGILARAKKAGYLTATHFSDLSITGMNFGFELTGTYKAAIKTENVGIYVDYKEE